jgi:hypothetical protein
MKLGHESGERADARDDSNKSWVELFPFVLMAVVMMATIVAIVVGGDS